MYPDLDIADDIRDRMVAWRRDIHANPETAFEEHRTANLVANLLELMGLSVHRGLAGTGVVATLKNGEGPSIALRADLDALNMQELGTRPHASKCNGKMHACGHDGHTAMLLGAAEHLSRRRPFKGTVHFVFQPAEENEGGGRVMVEEGLFDRFPADAVYGMHNFPGLPRGRFAIRVGTMTAYLRRLRDRRHRQGQPRRDARNRHRPGGGLGAADQCAADRSSAAARRRPNRPSSA